VSDRENKINWRERILSFRFPEHQVYLLLALLVGAVVGLTVVSFMVLSEYLGSRAFPPEASGVRRLLIPIAGSLVTGYLMVRFFPAARGSGIPQTKVALVLQGGFISLATVIGRFMCSVTSLASGIALGREGPSVQIGAGIASVVGRRIGFSPRRVRALIPVGAAAAVSAAFNTPIAGVLFALEEVMGDLHAPVIGSAVISSATAWVVLHLLLGDEPLFHVPAYRLVHPLEFLVYAVLGVAGGFCSVAFVKMTLLIRAQFLRLPRHTQWAHPMAGGLVVGVLAIFVPQVLGVGYDYVAQVLNGEITLLFVSSLLVLKLIASAACYGSGNTGGIFGPSLFFGAMLGATVGSVAHHFLPTLTANPGAYALVGMGAVFAGIIRVPMTSVFMIFELTRDYAIVVPLMIANMVSFTISKRFQRVPVYEAFAMQDGIHLPRPARVRDESRGLVGEFMDRNYQTIPGSAKVGEVPPVTCIIENNGTPIGALSPNELQAARTRNTHREVASLVRSGASHLHPDQTVEEALERLQDAGAEAIPVLDRSDVTRPCGVMTLAAAQSAFGVVPG
jgi:CIC family chloride channel protein